MAFGNRGVYAEGKVQDYLKWWAEQTPFREFTRMVDTKAAGRTIKASLADFDYHYLPPNAEFGMHGLIEAKQTEHDYRLERDKVPQLPALRKREKCGGTSYVIVFHSKVKRWRAVGIKYLADTGDKGSWNLTNLPSYLTAGEALNALDPEGFPLFVKPPKVPK